MLKAGYFSIIQDQEREQAGNFWCEGCLVGKPVNEQSDDPRYCHFCFKFLSDEAIILGIKSFRGKKVSWVPVPGRVEALPVKKKAVAKLPDPTMPLGGIMQRTGGHPGRPKKEGEVHRATEWRRKQGVLL